MTDAERREVAAKLRMLQSGQFRDEERPEVTTWEGIGSAVLPDNEWQRIDRFKSRDNRTRAVRSVIAGRLADMIEPTVDRDALLALADEMDRRQHDIATAATDGVVDAWCLREYARRIRKACGEVYDE